MEKENGSAPAEQEKKAAPEQQEKPKGAFQKRKEEWYDHVNLSVKQLDTIIAVCFGCLILVFVLIALEAAGRFSLFPKH